MQSVLQVERRDLTSPLTEELDQTEMELPLPKTDSFFSSLTGIPLARDRLVSGGSFSLTAWSCYGCLPLKDQKHCEQTDPIVMTSASLNRGDYKRIHRGRKNVSVRQTRRQKRENGKGREEVNGMRSLHGQKKNICFGLYWIDYTKQKETIKDCSRSKGLFMHLPITSPSLLFSLHFSQLFFPRRQPTYLSATSAIQQIEVMLILFINAHKKTEQGKVRFSNFYSNVRSVLKSTIFFGNEVTETIRNYDDLDDYIYDEITFRMQERARRKFQSLEYIFIDGNHNVAPWSELMVDVMLIIRKSIDTGKKIYCNDFAHFASYYYLATKFDKYYTIATAKHRPGVKATDYDYEEESGDLYYKGKRVCNSGLKLIPANRPFADRSGNAVDNGVVLSTKFDYVVFNSKSGSKILRNINVPFAFYWRSKLFCTPRLVSQAKADVLFETELNYPLAFTCKNLLSTQGLCSQFLKLLKNWLSEQIQRKMDQHDDLQECKSYQSIAFENKIELKKAMNSTNSLLKFTRTSVPRPLSSKSKFSTIDFEKPTLRCSGKYETLDERYLNEQLQKKSLNLGKSRMVFKGKLDDMEIPNYVQRQPSRPSSSHKFREVHKEKWINKHDFFNC